MKDLHLRLLVRFQLCVERVERHEAEAEHALTEFTWELPHLVEQLPHLVALIGGGR